jgi:hypothetical protein
VASTCRRRRPGRPLEQDRWLRRVVRRKGSGVEDATFYHPGIQAWYKPIHRRRDPTESESVFVGLEESTETEDGGSHWTTIGPYWNFGSSAGNVDPSRNTCPLSTHSDQHSIVIDGNRLYVGNDGGIFRRPLRGHVNANGQCERLGESERQRADMQYYSVSVGKVPGGVAVSAAAGQRRIVVAPRRF